MHSPGWLDHPSDTGLATTHMSESVVITHAECFTALGDSSATFASLCSARSGITQGPCCGVPVPWAPFADSSLRDITTFFSRVRDTIPPLDSLPGPVALVFCAAKADLRLFDAQSEGSQTSGLPSGLLSQQAAMLADCLGLRGHGRLSVISTACASGVIGLEYASGLLRDCSCASAVLVGYDSLSRFVTTGFHALGALSAQPARPFDKNRAGLTLGEGGVVMVLQRAQARMGDCVLSGAASANDANHRTGPSRTGEGLYRAARAALDDAGVEPTSVGAVKCHGTATAYNDAMEAKALVSLFGTRIPPCVSFKGALGHTSGGGSLLESVLALRMLRARTVPPTVGYEVHGVDEPVPIGVAQQPFSQPRVLCLSAGFGGINAAALFTEIAP